MSYSLSLCTYDRGKDLSGNTKPYHWAFFIATNGPDTGIAHQLRGMPGAFYYRGPEVVSDLRKSGSLNNEVEIGAVPAGSLNSVKALLERVNIVKDESSDWNCQSWSKDAFDLMHAQGWLWYEFEVIKSWVKEA